MVHITTPAVFSKLADPQDVQAFFGRALPIQLRQHQLATAQALADPDCDIVINTALTGDGKSLAGRLDTLTGPQTRKLLALYPTNDLTLDQLRQDTSPLIEMLWGLKANRVERLSAAHLDELTDAEAGRLTRPETLLQVLSTRRLVLTNPDMFHGMVQFHYQQFGRDPAHIAGRLTELFERIVADEFHSYDAAQVTALLTGLVFLYAQKAPNQSLKTLLLSATPTPWVKALLDRAGFAGRWREINPVAESWYQHGTAPDTNWSCILHQTNLHLLPARAEDWLPDAIETIIVPWFTTHGRGARVAIIVNSVATAQRMLGLLKSRLEPLGKTVEPITGLDDRPTRARAIAADVLVGTSTVDVGVDFKINLLIFEAPTAAAFGQRLGRLARHQSYTDAAGVSHPFHAFAAYALLPAFVFERLSVSFDGAPPLIEDGKTIDRITLSAAINAPTVYPPVPSLEKYIMQWGRFVPAKVLLAVRGQTGARAASDRQTANTFEPLNDVLWRSYGRLTRTKMSDAQQAWKQARADNEELLVREAQSFRGGSPFQCIVLRADMLPVAYDLLWLLRYAEMTWLEESAWVAAAHELTPQTLSRTRPVGVGQFHRLRERHEQPLIVLFDRAYTRVHERASHAHVLDGLKVDVAGHNGLYLLNQRLAAQELVVTCVPDFAPDTLRQAIYLPGTLPLLPYQYSSVAGGGTIAFGRAALLLDSALRGKRITTTATGPIIC